MIRCQIIFGIDLLNLTLGPKHPLVWRQHGLGTVYRTTMPFARTTPALSQLGFYMLARLMAQLNHI
jgi:hypothetical protein